MDCCTCYNDIWKPCFVSYQGFKLLRLRLSSSSWSLILQKITIDNYGWYDHNCGRDVIIETSEIFTLWSKLQSWILLLVILALVLLLSFCLFLLCMKESYKSFVFCELERERERELNFSFLLLPSLMEMECSNQVHAMEDPLLRIFSNF